MRELVPADALREAMEVRTAQTAYLGERGGRAARRQRGGGWGLFREGTRAQRRPGTDGTSRLPFHGNTQHPIFGYKGFRFGYKGFRKVSLFCLSSCHSWLGQGQTIVLSRGLWGVTRDGVGDPWVMSGGANRLHSTPTPACSEMPIGYSGAHTVCLQMVLNVGIISLYTV